MGQEEQEAELIAQYLLGVSASQRTKDLYREALTHHKTPLNKKEVRIWQLVCTHPWLFPYIDAGLAITERFSPIRKRIFIMFAILETEHTLAERFIYRKRSAFWLFISAFYSIRSLARAFVGNIMIRLI